MELLSKKSIISASLLLATTVSFAQIEVLSNGNVGVGNPDTCA